MNKEMGYEFKKEKNGDIFVININKSEKYEERSREKEENIVV